jgi:hypothetical protein
VKDGSVVRRVLSRRLAVVAALVFGTVALVAAPASAHTLTVSGTTVCPDSDHIVTWTIHNNETLPTRTMNFARVTATVDGVDYGISGYASSVPPGGSTTGTTTVPGNINGTITLTVHAVWADGYRGTTVGTVLLVPPCPMETTTTTTATTSTTGPTTTTTGGTGATTTTAGGPDVSVASTSTTIGGVAGVESGPSTTASATSGGSLPFTGSNGGTTAVVGVTALGLGLVLLAGAKRAGAFNRH